MKVAVSLLVLLWTTYAQAEIACSNNMFRDAKMYVRNLNSTMAQFRLQDSYPETELPVALLNENERIGGALRFETILHGCQHNGWVMNCAVSRTNASIIFDAENIIDGSQRQVVRDVVLKNVRVNLALKSGSTHVGKNVESILLNTLKVDASMIVEFEGSDYPLRYNVFFRIRKNQSEIFCK